MFTLMLGLTLAAAEPASPPAAADAPENIAAATTVPAPEAAAPDATLLDAIVVIGSRGAEPLRQVVGAVSRLDREQLERRGVQTLDDLSRLVPGLDVAGDGHRFGNNGFNLRGLEGNRVYLELDGVPLADSFAIGEFASAGRDLVELGIVDRVEVLRGPASTLHGSKALAGVVAFWTLDPLELYWQDGQAWQGQLRGGAGSRDDGRWLSGRFVSRSQDGRLAGLVSLGRRQGHETENRAGDPALAANPADYRLDSALARLALDAAGARWLATLERGEGERRTDVRSQLFGPGRFSTTYALHGDDRYRRDRLSLSAQWQRLGPLDGLQLLAYQQSSDTDQRSDQFRLPDRATPFPSQRWRQFRFGQDSLGLKLTGQWRGELAGLSHWQVFGLDLVRHDYSGLRDGRETNLLTGASSSVVLGEAMPVRDFPDSRVSELGLFWQDEIRFGRHWALVPGLRWERYRLRTEADRLWREDNPDSLPAAADDSRFTPKLGLRWQRGELTLYGQYAEGFRAPPFSDVNIGLYLPVFNYVVLSNPALRPERSRGLELGLRWAGQDLQASLAVYENRYRDLIDSRANLGVNESGQLLFQSVNRARARIRGVELEGRFWLEGWSPRARGWYLDALAHWSEGEDSGRDLPLNTLSPARASLALGWSRDDDRGGAELRLTGVRAVGDADQSAGPLFLPPGYATLDLHAWWNLGERLQLNASIGNLADRRYWDWAMVRGLPADDPRIDFHSRPGRSLSLGLRYDF